MLIGLMPLKLLDGLGVGLRVFRVHGNFNVGGLK